ncbi:hypothetical protein, partial [Microbacterium sp. gxy059]|uniref:hypothetical protein n=1 Tax=Microbacterium sp. gxy059 TaxID=2957199 RepID=UPI003D98CBD1
LSLRLAGIVVISLLVCAQASTNALRFSADTAARIARFADRNDMRFRLWRPGGGYEGLPFSSGVDHARFATVSGSRRGTPVEFGNLVSRAQAGFLDRHVGYIAIRLPERLPPMAVDAGRLARVFGVPLPSQRHRSQRVDVGAGRSFRLYVADGAEPVARALFDPETVALFARVATRFDAEFAGRHLILSSRRLVSTGSAWRWREEIRLVDEVVAVLGASPAWDLVRRWARGRGPQYGPLRWAVAGPVITIASISVVAIAVLVALALGARS